MDGATHYFALNLVDKSLATTIYKNSKTFYRKDFLYKKVNIMIIVA